MKGKVVSVEVTEQTRSEFLAAAREAGLHDDVCGRCTRPFVTRSNSSLCPPCRGLAKEDGWTPAHTRRALEFGSAVPRPGLATCAACGGLGVVGWEPFKHGPACSACHGFGQEAS